MNNAYNRMVFLSVASEWLYVWFMLPCVRCSLVITCQRRWKV